MIIWLASYPKSGNTWIRSFISALLYTDEGENDFYRNPQDLTRTKVSG